MTRWLSITFLIVAMLGDHLCLGQNLQAKMIVNTVGGGHDISMAVDGSGNVYHMMSTWIGGFVEIEGERVPDSLQTDDRPELQVAKFDSKGNKMWARTVGRGAMSGIVTVDREDNPVIWAFAGVDIALLAKLDKDGNEIWIRYEEDVEGKTYLIRDVPVAFDHNNDIIVLADKSQYRKRFPFDFDSLQDNGLMLIKYTKDGERLWQREAVDCLHNSSFASSPPDDLGISVDPHGSLFIRGRCSDEFVISDVPLGSYFVAKFTSEGQYLWVNEIFNIDPYSWPQLQSISSFIPDSDGNLYLVGTSLNGEGRSIVMCLDGNGEKRWERFGMFGNNYISLDREGNLLVSGKAHYGGISYQNFHSRGNNSVLRLRSNGDFIEGWTLDSGKSFLLGTLSGPDDSYYTGGAVYGRTSIGCDSVTSKYAYAMFVVKYDKFPDSQIVSITGPEEVCEGGQVTLTCSYVETTPHYTWDLPYDAIPVSGTSTTTWNSITLVAGRFSNDQPIRVAVERDCYVYYASPYVVKLVTPLEGPILLEGADSICAGDQLVPYQVKSMPESPKIFKWKYPNGSDSASTSERELLVNYSAAFAAGSLWYEASNACGPLASDTIKVSTFITPDRPIIKGEHEVCQGVYETRWEVENGTGAETFVWSLPHALIPDPRYPTDSKELIAQALPLFLGGEIVVVAIGKCKHSEPSEPFRVDVPKLAGPVGAIQGPEKICDEHVVYSSVIPNGVEYVWSVPDQFKGGGIVTSNTSMIDLSVASFGAGSISLFARNRCGISSDTLVLDVQTFKVYDKPAIQAETCSTTLTIEEAEGIEWYKDGQLVGTDTPELTLLDSGVYHVRIGNYCGEQRSEPKMIYPVIPERIETPNAITSNGDIYNEYFQIDKSLVSLASLHVYDRSGNLVFNSGAYDNTWNAAASPPGVYYAVISHPCLPRALKGTINVIK